MLERVYAGERLGLHEWWRFDDLGHGEISSHFSLSLSLSLVCNSISSIENSQLNTGARAKCFFFN